jgi:hydrogenase maturation protease
MPARTLIACLGNIFLGDDGFGVEVARRLAAEDLPDGTRLTDYGIRGMHLAYDLAEGWDTTILVDAASRGGTPGTVYVIEPEPQQQPAEGGLAGSMLFDAHGMQPDVLLGMAGMLGAEAGRVLVVGCEPASVAEGIGLSTPVAAAVDEAARVVMDLVGATGAGPDMQDNPAGETAGSAPAADHGGPGRKSAGGGEMAAKE